MGLMIGRVKQESQWHLKNLVHLTGIRAQLKRWRNDSHHGRYAKAGNGTLFGQVTDDLNVIR